MYSRDDLPWEGIFRDESYPGAVTEPALLRRTAAFPSVIGPAGFSAICRIEPLVYCQCPPLNSNICETRDFVPLGKCTIPRT